MKNSFETFADLTVSGQSSRYCSLAKLEQAGFSSVSHLPYSLKILLENLLRHEDGRAVTGDDIAALAQWEPAGGAAKDIAFSPARVLLQDFTGVPAVVDLAAIRDGVARLGGDPKCVNPLQPVELVIDHSVQVDYFGRPDALLLNAELEYQRNRERYAFLRWGQNAFGNFQVVPPETGIVHQVNLEYLARVVCRETIDGQVVAFPDTLVGTDSHTTMVNGLGVIGWGVGGIEAEAAMLGQPISMLAPDVVGFRLTNRLNEGITATDLVLTITERLRRHGVVGKFVEFYGSGLEHLTIADRATLGNMAPEYGATVAVFPIDDMTLDYLRLTGRDSEHVALVEAYAKAQGLFRDPSNHPEYTTTLELDLATVEASLAGPKRPQDRVALSQAKTEFANALSEIRGQSPTPTGDGLEDGSVVVAAITSCTNTSNPSVLIGAGLLAKKAVERGLKVKPWVKTSLAPGSKVVTEYLKRADLLKYLEALGFHLVGYGCTTCIGNSGPLPKEVSDTITARDLVVTSVLSGNRNFEGRIQQQIRANYLASPPLVVAYALAGRMTLDLTREALGLGSNGQEVFLSDIWPTSQEIQTSMSASVRSEMFTESYRSVFVGDSRWQALPSPEGDQFAWDAASTYIRHPPFFEDLTLEPSPIEDICGARVLAVLADSVTTDHISPAGAIPVDSPAGRYLTEHGIPPAEFNSYGARRGNHEVMVRGTFGNIRLRNQLAPGTEGGWTRYQPEDEQMPIYDAAVKYREAGTPLVVLAGKEYGSGSSRDWAAKGTRLLGVRVVLAESFERIHRSNLVNMGVLPLEFSDGGGVLSFGLTGSEMFDFRGIVNQLAPRGQIDVRVQRAGGEELIFPAIIRIDTPEELVAFQHGGILPYVLRQIVLSQSRPQSDKH